MHFRWLWRFCLDFVFCASASCALLKFCNFGKSAPLHWFLYFCILAFVLLALCCDFVFLYFRSSARITVMCQCVHLDTVLPPSSSTSPFSIQRVHNNIIPLKYVHTKIIPISHVQFMPISCFFLSQNVIGLKSIHHRVTTRRKSLTYGTHGKRQKMKSALKHWLIDD